MKLKQVHIERYGPLPKHTLTFKKGIQPIFGGNESGKTLLVDALIKMLTGKTTGWDAVLDRVEEVPEGFLVFEDNGDEFKLEKGNTLSDFLAISAEELRNIFVVRNSDLEIPRQIDFYEKITDRITGLRSGDIGSIIEKLREMGRLTEGKNITGKKGFGNPKGKLKDAENLRGEIKDYLKTSQSNGIASLETQIFKTESEYANLTEQIRLQEKSREKSEFLKLESILRSSRRALSNLKKIPNEEKISTLRAIPQAISEKKSRRVFFERVSTTIKWPTILMFPFLATIWITSIVYGITNQAGLAAFSILAISMILGLQIWSNRKIGEIGSETDQLYNKAREIGVTASNASEMTSELKSLTEKRRTLTSKLEQNIGVLKNAFDIDKKLHKDVLNQASEALAKRKENIDLDINIVFDEKKLRSAKERIGEIKSRLNDLRTVQTGHIEKLKRFSEKALGLDFPRFLERELDVQVENLESLELVTKEITEFKNRIENDAELCKFAIEVFEEMKEEEIAKISGLFGEESATSKIFSEITDGRYTEVRYDRESKKILAVRPSGQELMANKLSKGAFDQLYLSIRIDLAERMLADKRGFFIMDDAFLSSGSKRLEKGIGLLKSLADRGWQIIYFTVKDRDSRLLSKISGNKAIHLPPLV